MLVEGQEIELDRYSLIDVSGTLGGVALVGGDYQGGVEVANNYAAERIKTAKTLKVAEGARIAADGTAGDGGKVVLWSDIETDFAGEVSARSAAGRGGDAEISGKVLLSYTGDADLSGSEGAGELLLDPYNIKIIDTAVTDLVAKDGEFTADRETSYLTYATLQRALSKSNVKVKTGSVGAGDGDISVGNGTNSPFVWSGSNTLTLEAYRNITINETMRNTGLGGLVLRADATGIGTGTVILNNQLNVRGGTLILHNGANDVVGSDGAITRAFSNHNIGGTIIESYKLVNNAADLSFIRSSAATLSGYYALGKNIDFGGAALTPIGTVGGIGGFKGTFNGLNNEISNYSISASGNYLGLFGNIDTGIVRNLNLRNVTINAPAANSVGALAGQTTAASLVENVHVRNVNIVGDLYTGGLIGYAAGNITASSVQEGAGIVGGNVNFKYAGGLVGSSNKGGITNSFAEIPVTGQVVGGLVGVLGYEGTISRAYATGNVDAALNGGGLVGSSYGSIDNSYATGSVKALTAGGLVGFITNTSTTILGKITYSYASGSVTTINSANPPGGLIGTWDGVSIVTNSFWNSSAGGEATQGVGKNTNGHSTAGIIALSNINAFSQLSYKGFDFSKTGAWYMLEGDTRPFLRMELDVLGVAYGNNGLPIANTYNISNANQLQLISAHAQDRLTGNRTYILGNDLDLSAALANGNGHWRNVNTKDDTAERYGFSPIGNSNNAFTGTFNGNGFKIQNLFISRKFDNNTGLFGVLGYGAHVHDVTLNNAYVTGNNWVGALAGQTVGAGKITDVSASNVHINYGNSVPTGVNIGGLIGVNTFTVKNASISNVDIHMMLKASGTAVGGLVGVNTGTLDNVFIDGSATIYARESVGGLVGINKGVVRNATVTNAVVTAHMLQGGGLVGLNDLGGSIEKAAVSLSAVYGASGIGGFAGVNNARIRDAAVKDVVVGKAADNVIEGGGFVGNNQSRGLIEAVFSEGVTVTGDAQIGGLVGYNQGIIKQSYVDTNQITSKASSVTSTGKQAGGLVGDNAGSIIIAYATATIAGLNQVGGLVGRNRGTIDDAYATGKVSAQDLAPGSANNVGGLVGWAESGRISRIYATGSAELISTNVNVGGLVGFFTGGTINGSFWNTDVNNQGVVVGAGASSTAGIIGLSAAEFKDTAIFMSKATGWNFSIIWAPPGEGYNPELYALSKVIRVHSSVGLGGITYGDSTVSVDNSALSQNTVIYGAGAYAKDDAAYDKTAAAFNFGTQADYNIGPLNAGKQTISLGAAGSVATDQGFRIVYTTGILVAKKAITLDITDQKTYDGQAWTGASLAPTLVDGSTLAFGQSIADLGGVSLSGHAVGAVNAGKYTINAAFDNTGTANNYAITYANRLLTVDKAQLLVGDVTSKFNTDGIIALDDLTREYDATTKFAYGDKYSAAYNFTHAVTNETIQLTLGGLAYNEKDADVAGTQVIGQWRIISAEGNKNLASNYILVDTSSKADNSFSIAAAITQKTIDISAVNLGNKLVKTYDGTTNVTKDGSFLQTISGAGNERLTITLDDLRYADANAGSGIDVTGVASITGIAGNKALISNYKFNDVNYIQAGEIKQAVISLSGLKIDPNKTYDGSNIFILADQTVKGVNNENIIVSLAGATYADANAGRTSVTGTWNIVSADSNVGNYRLAQTEFKNATATIRKAMINVSDLGLVINADKTYDGSTVFSYADQSIATGVGSESLTLSLTGGRYSAADAGLRNVTGRWVLSDDSGMSKNYQLANVSLSLKNVTIAKAKIDAATINAAVASISADKVYDGRNIFSPAAVTGINTGINGEALTIRLQNGLYADANAGLTSVSGVWKVVSVVGGRRNSNNYELVSPTFSLAATITPAVINVSRQTFKADKAYDGSDVFTLASRQIFTGVGGEHLTLNLINGKYSSPNAGNVIVTGTWQVTDAAMGLGAALNYVLANSAVSVNAIIR
ncbi:YDG domain-containing protein [Pseudochelatococcus sp. G4_1912]|uniref:YDG domain-containing protein n=1 Tax=Pseudochelatococcus sp. G4_1912 TaxID=3114288 RepID=UPI0039C6C0FB